MNSLTLQVLNTPKLKNMLKSRQNCRGAQECTLEDDELTWKWFYLMTFLRYWFSWIKRFII